ncbi:basic proline-rich protein-like [Sagmatias obliquidens]|uniref:basic proline-rich protein-like n=1 Tax=Sagmatias obliquidens TaxID=3371155 RepID=UPI000F43E99F|nr:basic proline-rich protein-like [Lagenorhynchus obliquidens]
MGGGHLGGPGGPGGSAEAAEASLPPVTSPGDQASPGPLGTTLPSRGLRSQQLAVKADARPPPAPKLTGPRPGGPRAEPLAPRPRAVLLLRGLLLLQGRPSPAGRRRGAQPNPRRPTGPCPTQTKLRRSLGAVCRGRAAVTPAAREAAAGPELHKHPASDTPPAPPPPPRHRGRASPTIMLRTVLAAATAPGPPPPRPARRPRRLLPAAAASSGPGPAKSGGAAVSRPPSHRGPGIPAARAGSPASPPPVTRTRPPCRPPRLPDLPTSGSTGPASSLAPRLRGPGLPAPAPRLRGAMFTSLHHRNSQAPGEGSAEAPPPHLRCLLAERRAVAGRGVEAPPPPGKFASCEAAAPLTWRAERGGRSPARPPHHRPPAAPGLYCVARRPAALRARARARRGLPPGPARRARPHPPSRRPVLRASPQI